MKIRRLFSSAMKSSGRYWKRRLILLGVLPAITLSTNAYSQEVNDHFDGTRFFNSDRAHDDETPSLMQRFKRIFSREDISWPEWVDDPKQPGPPAQVKLGELRVSYINQATMLIQVDEVNILTDPIWSERASIVSWAGPKRVRSPGIALHDLPKIDLILVSHSHYDHLDIPTLKQLSEMYQPIICVGLGVKALLDSEGVSNVVDMDWWQEYTGLSNGIKTTFVPAHHGSGRGMFDRNKTLWGGFVIGSDSGNIYFAGDTARGEFLNDIRDRFGQFRLALFPIGHYKPRWMMKNVHMSPDDAVISHKLLNVKQSVGMHFSTFYGFGGHNKEKIDEHKTDLATALEVHGVDRDKFWVLGFGEGRYVK